MNKIVLLAHVLFLAALLAAPTHLAAQEPDTTRLDDLEERIEALTRELERLRLGDEVVRADTSIGGFGLGASKVYRVERGVSLGGYGEVLYENFSDEREDGSPASNTDQFDALRAILYIGYKFNDRLLFNSELEIEHGAEQYRWDGYLWWTVSVDDPTYPEYSMLSNREADFYFRLNQVAVDLQVDAPGALVVNLDTQTPNLDRYEVAIDDASWTSVESGFRWALNEGANRLRVRVVNAFGVMGRGTTVGITRRGAGG